MFAVNSSTKDHHAEREDVESWRSQNQSHHQGYAASMGSDPYMQSYYGSSQYPSHTYGVAEAGGPWSSNGGHYDGMFAGGNASGGFGEFGGQPGYGYGFHGNGDYSAWGPQPRKHYNEYYRDGMYGDDRGIKNIEQGMGSLGIGGDKDVKDFSELMTMPQGGSQKKTTWASIASQPAKPQSIGKKSKPGMPLPPMMPGAWESKNGVAKAPIAAPVQAPAWERPKVPPPVQPPVQQPPPPVQTQNMPPLGNQNIPPGRGYQPPPMSFMPPPSQGHVTGGHPPPSSQAQPPLQQKNVANGTHNAASSPPKYPDETKMKEYNPTTFDLLAEGSRFFVIKSYSEDDIHRSIKYEIWCSTEHGNKRLDEAFKERESKGPLYLFFSVNGSGHFCGMAQMISAVDYNASSSVWSQDKWKGQFKVKWIYVKDVPNGALRHIRLENNENKPVTNSRDTQEVPFEKGKQVLKILHSYNHSTSIFDDFIHYEKRQEEEDQRKTVTVPHQPPHNVRNDRGVGGGGGRGNFHGHDRGGFRGHGHGPGHMIRNDQHMEHGRDFRDHRGGRGDGFMHRDRMDPREREHFSQRDDRDPREREHRGGYRGGRGGMHMRP